MLSYMTIGADDVPRSGRFYAAILVPLGYEMTETAEGIEFTVPEGPGRPDGSATLYVKKPFDGKAATVGNGSMAAFRAETHALVRSLHAASLAAGGPDEGAPGFRDAYRQPFYVGITRDPPGTTPAILRADPPARKR